MNIPSASGVSSGGVSEVSALSGAPALSHVAADVHADTLRRQLQAEFQQIEQVIREAVILDPLTNEIALWLNNFRQALRSSPHTEEVYRCYAGLLQADVAGSCHASAA